MNGKANAQIIFYFKNVKISNASNDWPYTYILDTSGSSKIALTKTIHAVF